MHKQQGLASPHDRVLELEVIDLKAAAGGPFAFVSADFHLHVR